MEDGGSSATDALNDHPNGILHTSSMNYIIDEIDGVFITRGNNITVDSLREDDALKIGLQQPQVTGKDKHSKPSLGNHQPLLFSAKELSTSIISSENTRIMFSFSIALLVVLSYIDYPLLGINIVNSKSIIALRPLYMVFITEITVLIAYLVLERRRRFDEHDTRVSKGGGGVNWDRAEMLLEGGVVVHQAVRAVFTDFSVYMVTVICILSLVQVI